MQPFLFIICHLSGYACFQLGVDVIKDCPSNKSINLPELSLGLWPVLRQLASKQKTKSANYPYLLLQMRLSPQKKQNNTQRKNPPHISRFLRKISTCKSCNASMIKRLDWQTTRRQGYRGSDTTLRAPTKTLNRVLVYRTIHRTETGSLGGG